MQDAHHPINEAKKTSDHFPRSRRGNRSLGDDGAHEGCGSRVEKPGNVREGHGEGDLMLERRH